jgi:FkbH-like protein
MQGLWWLPRLTDWSDDLAAAKTPRQFVRLAAGRLDFVQTLKLDRAFQRAISGGETDGLERLRLAVLSSSTAQHLIPGLRVAGLRRGLILDIHVGPFGLYQQELRDPASDLHGFRPEAVLFAFDADHLLGAGFAAEPDLAEALVEDNLARIGAAWTAARGHFGCLVLQQAILPTKPRLLGGNEHRFAASHARLLERLNEGLRARADLAAVDMVSIDHWALQEGLDHWHDPALWHRAKQDVSPAAGPVFGDLVLRTMEARRGRSAKCLVLDLDNTLWGGVIGDDGLDRIVLGPGSTAGEAFSGFQDYAKALARRGILLAVCSKNDLQTALAAFDRHPEMRLRSDDIATFSVNWHDKAANIREIADRLGLGLDALVFADDNPFERNLARTELPMVRVPELPEDPALYARCLAASGYFEGIGVTAEDTRRAELYRARGEEATARASATDMAFYLSSLGMALHWSPFQRVDVQRVTQLANKTNQFNLRTRRYSEAEIEALLDRPDSLTLQIRLVDRFADHGIVSLIVAHPDGETTLHIETWLMSCRVLGRGVEDAVANLIFREAARLGARTVAGEYVRTGRNAMVETLYPRLGFMEHDSAPGTTRWIKRTDDHRPIETHIRILRSSGHAEC